MAFMFIVTILVIAICRVQIKRAMNSRCSQQNRNAICGRRAVPLYDLDVYLNRTADTNYPGGESISSYSQENEIIIFLTYKQIRN